MSARVSLPRSIDGWARVTAACPTEGYQPAQCGPFRAVSRFTLRPYPWPLTTWRYGTSHARGFCRTILLPPTNHRRRPQDSPYIEWYYRSLAPNVHYIPFWLYDRDDLLHVLRDIANKVTISQSQAETKVCPCSHGWAR